MTQYPRYFLRDGGTWGAGGLKLLKKAYGQNRKTYTELRIRRKTYALLQLHCGFLHFMGWTREDSRFALCHDAHVRPSVRSSSFSGCNDLICSNTRSFCDFPFLVLPTSFSSPSFPSAGASLGFHFGCPLEGRSAIARPRLPQKK